MVQRAATCPLTAQIRTTVGYRNPNNRARTAVRAVEFESNRVDDAHCDELATARLCADARYAVGLLVQFPFSIT